MRLQPCALTLLTALLLEGAAHAQLPPPPVTRGYYSRAYQHFLRSNAPVKTYSSLKSGYQSETVTPFSYESRYLDPAYEHQRIDREGFEHYYQLPGYGSHVQTPFGGSGYDVQGRTGHYFVPHAAPTPAPAPALTPTPYPSVPAAPAAPTPAPSSSIPPPPPTPLR